MVQGEGYKIYPMELSSLASQQSACYGTTMCHMQRVKVLPSNSDPIHLGEAQ